jgi:hypothetical protein
MNSYQFDSLIRTRPQDPMPPTCRFWPGPGRTLLWGYDTDRNSWHVYNTDAGHIRLYIYRGGEEVKFQTMFSSLGELIPNKRLYPEACDYDFCRHLANQGIHLPFTNYNTARPVSTFYGIVK